MSYDFNRVYLIGRVGSEVRLRETKTGTTVGQFSLATHRMTVAAGDEPEQSASEETQWNKVVIWGKLAQNCSEYLKKGETVFVEGSLKINRYSDKEGVSRISPEVHADSVRFLGFPGSSRVSTDLEARLEATG